MCVVCGCSSDDHPNQEPRTGDLADQTIVLDHSPLNPSSSQFEGESASRLIKLETNILGTNNKYALQNREHFKSHDVCALNLMSSPGAGKTTLLCATIQLLKDQYPALSVAVIEGDQQTELDAERIRATGTKAFQVNTGKGCHLDAKMIGHAFSKLHDHSHSHHHHHHHHSDADIRHTHSVHESSFPQSLLFIENVGNLVCPARWDLGERAKVVILSVTEGTDKPLKYPDMFAACELMIINKIDLLEHVDFDVQRCIEFARRIKPNLKVIELSATNGSGMDLWIQWLLGELRFNQVECARQIPSHIDELLKKRFELEKNLNNINAELAQLTSLK